MNQYKTSAELKNLAKDQLLGKYGTVIMVILLSELINLFASYMLSMFTPTGGVIALIITLFVTFVVSSILGVMNAGLSLFFLKIACKQSYTVNDLFSGFREQPNKCLAISTLFTLLNLVCLTPYQVVSAYYVANPTQTKWAAITFFLMILGNFLYIPLSLSISQSFYLIWDFPQLTAKDTLRQSMQLMKGHKGRLFYIEMSFLPLMILSVFTCCIGFLWLLPYMHMTLAYFFLDLMNPKKAS